MPTYDVDVEGSTYEVDAPDPNTAWQWANYTHRKKKAAAPKPESGFMPALKAGAVELGGGISALAGKLGLKDVAQAEAEYQAAKKRAAEIYKPTEEWGLTKVSELLGGSLPYMAAPLAAGVGAAALPLTGTAAAVAGLGAAGLTSAGQFTATNLSRQLEEGKKLADTDLGSAALAAVPQAALDTLSMRMIPGIGRIFGQAGVKVTAETAKDIAEQGLKKTLIDYTAKTGKTAGIEGLTESAQQVFERLQAGLSITDEKARQEYFDSFLGGAVLGGTLAVPGRYVERGREQREARGLLEQQAAEERKATAAAEEAKKKDPQYLLDLDTNYQAAVERMKELQAAVPKRPAKGALPEEQMAYKEAVEARNTHLKEVLQPLAAEYVPRKAEIAQLKERQRVEGMTPLEYQLEQTKTAPIKGVMPGEPAPTTVEDTEIFPTVAPAASELVYANKQIALANEKAFVDEMDVKDRPAAYIPYLMQDPAMAQALVTANTPIPGLKKRESNAVLSGLKLQLAEQAAQQRAAEEKRQAAEEQRKQQQEQARAAFEATQRVGQGVESFQQRMGDIVEKSEQQRATAQAFEALAPKEGLAAPSRALADVTQQLQLSPETQRLDRINQAIRTTEALIASRKAAGTETAVPEQRLVKLQKLKDDAERNYQRKLFDLSAEGKALPRKQLGVPVGPRQRVPGEFKLFGEAEAIERPVTYEDLSERLARAQATPGLSDDAYDFLSRIESVLPPQDTEGFYSLIDQQLRLIELGQEGMARPGAGRTTILQAFPATGRAAIEAPTTATTADVNRQALFQQKLAQGASRKEAAAAAFKATPAELEVAAPVTPAERKETEITAAVEKRLGRDISRDTVRGPSAKALPLSMQAALEPLVSRLEQGRAETQAGQQVLFPEEQEKIVTERKTPGQFRRFLKSAAAEKLRDIADPGRVVARAKTKLAEIQKTLDYLQDIINEINDVRETVFPTARLNAARRELATLEAYTEGRAFTSLGEAVFPATQERIDVLRKFIKTAETQNEKLKQARTLLKKQGRASLDNYEFMLRESGGIITKVVTQAELKGQLQTLERLRNERLSVIQQANISAEDKAKLAEQVNAIGAEQIELQKQAQDLAKKLAYIDANIRLEDAQQRLSDYADRAEPDEAMLAAATKDVSVAKRTANKLRLVISQTQRKLTSEEAQRRREREAVDREERRTASTERFKAEQARLERMQSAPEGVDVMGQPLKATIYPAINAAQRLARENPTPTILADEARQIRGNPQKVLSGYKSRITAITKALQAALDRARQQTIEGVKERKPYEAALAAYRAATASESPEFRAIEERRQQELADLNRRDMSPELRQRIYARINADAQAALAALPRSANKARINLEPRLRTLEAAYMDAVTNAMAARVMPKGVVGFQIELAEMLRKEAWLQDRISRGVVETEVVPTPKARVTKAEKDAQESDRLAQYTQEAARRIGAPEIDVTETTKSEIEKARKKQKTPYSGKGVGLETAITEGAIKEKKKQRVLLQQPMTPQQREQQAIMTIVDQAKDKLAKKQALTPVEQMVLDEYNRSRKPTKGKETTSEEEAPVEVSSEEMREQAEAQERAAYETEEVEETGEVKGGFGGVETLFDRPDINDIELSRGATPNPSTIDSVRTELSKAFTDLGRVQIFDTVDALIAANPQYEGKIPSDARGFVDTAGNKAFLIAENINQGQAMSVLLHEVGAHIGLKNMLGEAQYNALVNAVKSWEKKADGSVESRVAQAARARVEAAETTAGQVNDELLAYTIEEAVNAGIKPTETKGVIGRWLSQIAALFRRGLEKFGLPPKTLDAQGIVDMAFGAAKMEMRPAVAQVSRRQFLRGAGAALGGLKLPPLSKDMQLDALMDVFYGSLKASDSWLAAVRSASKLPDIKDLVYDYSGFYGGNNSIYELAHTDALRRFIYYTEYEAELYDDPRSHDELLRKLLEKDGVKVVADLQQALRAQAAGLVEAAQKLAKEKGLPEVGELFFSAPETGRVIDITKQLKERTAALEEKRDQLEDEADFKEYESIKTQLRELAKQAYERPIMALWPKIQAAKKALQTTKYSSSLEAKGLQKAINDFQADYIDRYNKLQDITEDRFDYRTLDRLVRESLPQELVAFDDYMAALSGEPKKAGIGEISFSRNLPTAARVANQIVGQQKGWLQKLRENFLGMGFRAQFVDMRFPLEEALKKGGVEDLDAMQAMYYVRKYDQKMHLVSEAITEGVPQVIEQTRPDGKTERVIEAKTGANLTQAYKILTSKEVIKEAGSADAANKLVTLYMASIRGANKGYDKLNFGRAWATQEIQRLDGELKRPGLEPAERANLQKRKASLVERLDTLPTIEDIKASRAEIEANPVLRDAFDKVREVYNEYNRNLLELAVQTGAISRDHARTLLAQNDYIPYYRMRGGVAEMVIGGETPIRIGNIKDNQELQELVGGDEPILDFITSSMQNTSMLVDMSLRNIAMKNAMFELRDVGLATIAKEPKGGAPKGSVTFKKDGEDYYAMVNTDALGISSDLLVKGLSGIPTMFPMWVRAMGVPARWLRRAIVAAPPYWAKQVFRDSLGASMSSGADIVPILGALRQIGADNVLERRGITGGQVFTGLPEDKKRMLAAMQSGKISLKRGMAWLEATSAKADALTRKNQYESYLAQGLSEMEATYMALESMNFSKRGLSPSVHYLNILIPFFNSQIQGLDALYKAFTGQMPMNERLEIRQKLWTRGMLMFSASLAYAYMMQDDEAYKNAKPEEKYGNWFVSLKNFGIDEPLRLPIPFELGYIFKALPEALVNSLMREDGAQEAVKALRHIVQQTIPGGSSLGMPAAVKPALETVLGVSSYTMRPIESAQEQMLEPGYRARESTTELARQIGEMTNFSPVKLESLVRGYTGSMGMAALAALSAPLGGTGPEPATKRVSDLPVVGTLFQPKDASGIIDATYEKMTKVNQLKETYEDLLNKGRTADAQQYYEKHKDDMVFASLAGSFKQFMGEITQVERAVRAAPNLTPDQKRQKLDELRQAKIRTASSVREMVEKSKRQAAPV